MIKGIVSAVPKNTVVNTDEAFIRATGVRDRRIVTGGQDVLTLAEDAANRLLDAMEWTVDSIDVLIFVTQTPTVRMPAMACILAGRLGMNCMAFDVNMACSGYVYGLNIAEQFSSRVLLICGDTISKIAAPDDKLFGDCVTATAIDKSRVSMTFILGTDGSGADKLTADPVIRMDGAAVMNFALGHVPQLVHDTTMNCNVDHYFFHQANMMILSQIGKKCNLDMGKVPFNIGKYGNTSSASIPLLMCDSQSTDALKTKNNRIAMFGFGAGWSWGGALMELEPLEVCEVIEI